MDEQKNQETFNFEEYQKKNEGLFQKFWKWLKSKWKLGVIIGVVGVGLSFIQVYKACTTSDAGKVIEKLYAENKAAIEEAQQLQKDVVLSDTLENLPEVKFLRQLQIDIIRCENFVSFSIYSPNQIDSLFKWGKMGRDSICYFISGQLLSLMNLYKDIHERSSKITAQAKIDLDTLSITSNNLYFLTQSAISNLFTQSSKEYFEQLKDNKYLSDEIIDNLKLFFASKELYNFISLRSKMHLNYMLLINQRLLFIKKRSLSPTLTDQNYNIMIDILNDIKELRNITSKISKDSI